MVNSSLIDLPRSGINKNYLILPIKMYKYRNGRQIVNVHRGNQAITLSASVISEEINSIASLVLKARIDLLELVCEV